MKLPNSPRTQSPKNLPVVFFGSSSYVIPIIEVLKKNFDLALVLTTEKFSGAVPLFCAKNKIKYLSVRQFNNLTIQQLRIIKAPVAVLADFGLIIPEEILNIFPQGIINLHPSLLPKYRGSTPVQAAILNGEKTTGISIMKLDDQVDHGPILAQEKEGILDTDTAETLYQRLFAKGANLLPKTIGLYLTRGLKLLAQNHEKATFTSPLSRKDGFVNLSDLKINNSLKIKNLKLKIRAYSPWPGVWFRTKLNGIEKIVKLLPNNLKTQFPNDLILIQVEGKKPMNYKDFLNGYPEAKELVEKLFTKIT